MSYEELHHELWALFVVMTLVKSDLKVDKDVGADATRISYVRTEEYFFIARKAK